MCQLMGLNRSAYYDYVRCAGNQFDALFYEEMLETIRGIAKSSNHSYGSRKSAECVGLSGGLLEGSKPDAGSRRASKAPEEVQGDD